MAILPTQVPEGYDGGYWYAVGTVPDEFGDPTIDINHDDYCAWYAEIDGVVYAAVRSSIPLVDLPEQPVTVADILAVGKQYGRIKAL